MGDVSIGVDAARPHKPQVDRGGDVAVCGVHPVGEVGGGEAVGAFFGVVGALDDVAADAG